MKQLATFEDWLKRIGAVKAFATLTTLTGSAAMAVNASGTVLFCSEGALSLLEISADAAVGKKLEDLVGPAAADTLKPVDGQAAPGFAPQTVSFDLLNGGRADCTVKTGLLLDRQARVLGALYLMAEQEKEIYSGQWLAEAGQQFHGILSRDPKMLQALKIIHNVAETDVTVLIRGESGTGKELVAHALHLESNRRNGPFLAINCAALTPSLLESELFGHVKGAFTGAVRNHAGLFQRAHGGTLFLDEVAELPLELQAKLLRVLQEKSFIPVGGDAAVSVDVRIIAATHRSLREEVKAGRFREDLMYRLRVVPVFLPPLRERRGDVQLLLWHCIEQHNRQGRRRLDAIAPDAMRILLNYRWPGNVRELKNVVEYVFAVGRGNELTLEQLPPEFHEPLVEPAAASITQMRIRNEAEVIREALQMNDGRVADAARYAGMSRATFWRKRKKYALD